MRLFSFNRCIARRVISYPVHLDLQFWLFKGFPVCFLLQTLPVPFIFSVDTGLSFLTASDELCVLDWLNVSVILFKLASFFSLPREP